MPEQSRRELLKAVSGIGIGAATTSVFAGTASAETLPNDIWSYDFGCDQDSNCPGTITSGEFVLRDDDEFTTVGSYGLNWYGTAYGSVLGWAHGLGFGGGCEMQNNDTWDGTSSNLRGQRYGIHVPNPTSSDEILKGTSNHLHGVHPSPTDDDMDWSKTILEAGVMSAMSQIDFGIPISTLVNSMAEYDGFDFDQYNVGYGYQHTSDSYPVEFWDSCAHSDAVIYTSGENLLETITVKHGYLEHIHLTGTAVWEDKEYTVSGFESNVSSSSNDLTTSRSNVDLPDSRPSSGHPEEMTPEERKQWGVKSVKGKGFTRKVNGQVEEITHVLTKNPFRVIDEQRTSEKINLEE